MLFGDYSGGEKTRFLVFSLSFAIFLACITGKSFMHKENGTELTSGILTFAKYINICTVFQDPDINTTYIKALFTGAKHTYFVLSKGDLGTGNRRRCASPPHPAHSPVTQSPATLLRNAGALLPGLFWLQSVSVPLKNKLHSHKTKEMSDFFLLFLVFCFLFF